MKWLVEEPIEAGFNLLENETQEEEYIEEELTGRRTPVGEQFWPKRKMVPR